MYFKVNGIVPMKKHIDVVTCQSNSKIVWPLLQQYWKLFYKSRQCTSLSVWRHEVCRRILCLFYGKFEFKLKEIWESTCVIWVGLCYKNEEIHISRKNRNVIN
jgi:glucuronate isomerase